MTNKELAILAYKEKIITYLSRHKDVGPGALSKAIGKNGGVISSAMFDRETRKIAGKIAWRKAFYELLDQGVIVCTDTPRKFNIGGNLHEIKAISDTPVTYSTDEAIEQALKELCRLVALKARKDVEVEIAALREQIKRQSEVREETMVSKFFNFNKSNV